MQKARTQNNVVPLSAGPEDPLHVCVEKAVRRYFADLNGHNPGDLHPMVMREVEAPLLRTVMDHVAGNQTRAAEILGINRSTLRKKLSLYGLVD